MVEAFFVSLLGVLLGAVGVKLHRFVIPPTSMGAIVCYIGVMYKHKAFYFWFFSQSLADERI